MQQGSTPSKVGGTTLMSSNFDDRKTSDLDSEVQSIENTKKMRSTDTETDEIEDIETTTIFTHFKKNW